MSACPVCGAPSYEPPTWFAACRLAFHAPHPPPALPCATHTWERISASLAEPEPDDAQAEPQVDFLDPSTPVDVVDQALRDAGLDPDETAAQGRALVERLRRGGVR